MKQKPTRRLTEQGAFRALSASMLVLGASALDVTPADADEGSVSFWVLQSHLPRRLPVLHRGP